MKILQFLSKFKINLGNQPHAPALVMRTIMTMKNKNSISAAFTNYFGQFHKDWYQFEQQFKLTLNELSHIDNIQIDWDSQDGFENYAHSLCKSIARIIALRDENPEVENESMLYIVCRCISITKTNFNLGNKSHIIRVLKKLSPHDLTLAKFILLNITNEDEIDILLDNKLHQINNEKSEVSFHRSLYATLTNEMKNHYKKSFPDNHFWFVLEEKASWGSLELIKIDVLIKLEELGTLTPQEVVCLILGTVPVNSLISNNIKKAYGIPLKAVDPLFQVESKIKESNINPQLKRQCLLLVQSFNRKKISLAQKRPRSNAAAPVFPQKQPRLTYAGKSPYSGPLQPNSDDDSSDNDSESELLSSSTKSM